MSARKMTITKLLKLLERLESQPEAERRDVVRQLQGAFDRQGADAGRKFMNIDNMDDVDAEIFYLRVLINQIWDQAREINYSEPPERERMDAVITFSQVAKERIANLETGFSELHRQIRQKLNGSKSEAMT